MAGMSSDELVGVLLRLGDRVCDEVPTIQVRQYPSSQWTVSLHAHPGLPGLVEGTEASLEAAVEACLKKLCALISSRALGDLEAIQEAVSVYSLVSEVARLESTRRALCSPPVDGEIS